MMVRSVSNKIEELAVAELAGTTMTESVSLTGNASPATVDLSDLVTAAGKLPVHASRPAWFMSPVVYAQTARRMVSNVASGQADLAYNKVQPMLLGLPVYLSSFLPANPAPSEAYAYLMDPEAAMVWATRGASSAKVRQFDQTLAAASQIYLRASVRGKVAVVDPSMCVRLVLAAS
jgi:HK97 family phage major capsid protein